MTVCSFFVPLPGAEKTQLGDERLSMWSGNRSKTI